MAVYSLEAHNSLKRRFMVGGYEVEVWTPGLETPDDDEIIEVLDALRDHLTDRPNDKEGGDGRKGG